MNGKSLITCLGVAGGAIGIVAGVLETYQTIDQMRHGIKLRDDQIQSMVNAISYNVNASITDSYEPLIDEIVNKLNRDGYLFKVPNLEEV